MCLVVSVELPYERCADLAAATRPAPEDQILVFLHPDRRWWLRRLMGPPTTCEAELGPEESGCGCGFLSDEASVVEGVWHMAPDMRRRLANAFETFVGSLEAEVAVSAIWSGDRVKTREAVSLDQLVALTRQGKLGTHTRYRIRQTSRGAR